MSSIIPKYISNRVPDRRPECMIECEVACQNVSDRLLEYIGYMSKYKSWHVKVGITRSKVFCDYWGWLLHVLCLMVVTCWDDFENLLERLFLIYPFPQLGNLRRHSTCKSIKTHCPDSGWWLTMGIYAGSKGSGMRLHAWTGSETSAFHFKIRDPLNLQPL